MGEPSPLRSPSHTRSQSSASTAEVPAGLAPPSEEQPQLSTQQYQNRRSGDHDDDTYPLESPDNGWANLQDDPELSTSLGRRASASSTSISPSAVSDNRVVKRRSSKRSNSSHSNSAAEDEGRFLPSDSAHLAPEHAASVFNHGSHARANSSTTTGARARRRDISTDIANHGLQHHSRDSSTSSPVLIYHPTIDASVHSRPQSISAWSNFTLGDDYGVDLGGHLDYTQHSGRGNASRHPLDIDDDRQHLTASMIKSSSQQRAGSDHSQSDLRLSDVDLEQEARDRRYLNVQGSSGAYEGRHRAPGTEVYYSQQSGQAHRPSTSTRRRTLLSNVQRELRKLSVRVVNINQKEDEMGDHVRLSSQYDEVDTQNVGKERAEAHASCNQAPPSADAENFPGDGNQALRGKSLGIFGPQSALRRAALSFFRWRWTEPAILLLIMANVIILTAQAAKDVFAHPRPVGSGYFREWEDYALFVIFVGFTLEAAARILVSGFIFNAEENFRTRSFRSRFARFRDRLEGRPVHAPIMERSQSSSTGHPYEKASPWDYANKTADSEDMAQIQESTGASARRANVSLQPQPSPSYPPSSARPTMRSFRTTSQLLTGRTMKSRGHAQSGPLSRLHEDVPFVQAIHAQRAQHADGGSHKAYLRHSWNRVDFVAVCAFWLMFLLASSGSENKHNLYIFRALAALRSARLLTITSGTTTILRSLKQSAPLMVSVAFFVIFAMALFSIVGVYSFKGSFQRTCTWIDPLGQDNYTIDSQRCGGHINASTGGRSAYIAFGASGPRETAPKGFTCPLGQLCVAGDNPNNGTQSFDNIFASLLQIVVVTGANGWVDIMYSMIDAEEFVACFFFIVCLVLLNFWLMNIFVAVIINTFGEIREETKHSAFAGKTHANVLAEESNSRSKRGFKKNVQWARVFKLLDWAWIAAVVADIGIQASKTSRDSPGKISWLNRAELYFTFAFLVEIIVRFMTYLPDYRSFPRKARNNADTFLAVTTVIIQIPVIRDSPVYPWLTVFQLMRFYRVILVVPRMKSLLAKVLSSVTGLVNMLVFLLVMNFVAAVIAVQFLRGIIPEEVDNDRVQYSFYQIYNSFLAIYVIFSSENWTNILYSAMGAEASYGQAWISAIFLSGWFLFANFILLQMFIAVINEGFAIAEEEKQKAQMSAFVQLAEPEAPGVNWIARLNPYRFIKTKAKVVSVETLPNNLVLPLGKATVRDYMGTSDEQSKQRTQHFISSPKDSGSFLDAMRRAAAKRGKPSSRDLGKETATELKDWDVDRHLDLLNFQNKDQSTEGHDAENERRAIQADFITAHPSYDRSLWIFSQRNPIRRFCQRWVEPAYGERIFGVEPNRPWVAAFKLLILCAIAGSVTIAAVANPAYRRDYYLEHGHLRLTWFNLTEVSLGFIFVVEFLVKVVADGFIFSPNAYLLSVWNVLDFFVLCTLVVNIGTALSPDTSATNRFTRSLKAFRALRLINLSSTMRQTFYNVMIVGAGLIFDASILTILYIIPFSVWGQNLFSGLLYSCNDGDVLGKAACIGEYTSSPAQWDILMPRAWQNPYVWSFDSFRSAILILFEIVSLEGWVDVMDSAMAIVGTDTQPQDNSSQYNSIFFLIYNLIGAIVVLTLFVSVIIENFTMRSGQALLTSEQRQWIDLKKLIVRQRPARRPEQRPHQSFRSWCFDRAVAKHGWWSRTMTTLYIVHIGVLASQTDTQDSRVDDARDYVFLALTLVYLFDIFIRMMGLGMKSFWRNGWNMYDVFAVTGTFATTIPLLLGVASQVAVQLQKLFLVSIAFKLVQKNNSLNQLFKTAAASLPAILNVFGLWLTFFLVWAIFFLETFSLTIWQANGTWTQNYSTFPKAMVMLSLMSTGEGWNAFMHDYTVEYPFCSPSSSYLFTDCGTASGSFVLFILWNVLSMYVLTNIVTGVVVENFSFVFSLYGRTTSLSRSEMRHFKSVWAQFDSRRSGYIKRKDFVPFLARMGGVFDVKLYDDAHRVKAITAACTLTPHKSPTDFRVVAGLDLTALDRCLEGIDYSDVARRKRRFNRLYQEALLAEEIGKGISFTNMLLMLAHHKLVEPERALKIQDLLQWKAKEARVDDLVSLDRVRGLLQTIFWRKRFLDHRAAVRAVENTVPEIILDAPVHGDSDGDMQRPRLSLIVAPEPASPTLSARTSGSTPPPAGRLSPHASKFADPFEDSMRSPRTSAEEGRRPSMGEDFMRNLADNDWSKMMEEELAKSD